MLLASQEPLFLFCVQLLSDIFPTSDLIRKQKLETEEEFFLLFGICAGFAAVRKIHITSENLVWTDST